jgi:hypothetical protein
MLIVWGNFFLETVGLQLNLPTYVCVCMSVCLSVCLFLTSFVLSLPLPLSSLPYLILYQTSRGGDIIPLYTMLEAAKIESLTGFTSTTHSTPIPPHPTPTPNTTPHSYTKHHKHHTTTTSHHTTTSRHTTISRHTQTPTLLANFSHLS